MTLAYIISAYKLPGQLTRLVSTLDAEASHFFVHVDRKTDDATYRQIAESLAERPNVRFLKRHRCDYGGFGHVRATLTGIAEIARLGLRADYTILLTGQDYPVKPNGEIEEFFRRHEGESFMEYFPLPSDDWERGGLDRITEWHVRVRGRYVRFPGRLPIPVRREFPLGLRPFGGSAYWCLSRECVDYVRSFLDASPAYRRFFKYVNVPDEIFFHSILLNSPLKERVVNDDLRYLEWRDPAAAGGPAVLTRGDFDKIVTSEKIFARKFDAGEDEAILDMIDAAIDDGRAQPSG